MAKKKLTTEAADVIVKLATSQGWGCQWILDGKTAIQESLDSVHWVETLRIRKRNLLAMARVLVGGEIYVTQADPGPWFKTGEVAALMNLTPAQLTSLVYRSEALGLTSGPDMSTGKARWSETDIRQWQQYQKEGRLPLRRKQK